MNERIKELAEQAWNTIAVSPDFGHPVSFAEKFAELILLDLISEFDQSMTNKENGFYSLDDYGLHLAKEIIKERFGVE